MALSWQKRSEFQVGGHELATIDRLSDEERRRLVSIAEGVIRRAEWFYLWRSRAWAMKWLEALKADQGAEWWAENRDEFYSVLVADEWFEPMLTGADLAAGFRTVFAGEEKGTVKK
jgi:hypothetical protein